MPTSDAERYEQLKAFLTEQQREKDQALGGIKEQLKLLKEQFGCSSVREARVKLREMEVERTRLTAKRDKAIGELEERFGERLDGTAN